VPCKNPPRYPITPGNWRPQSATFCGAGKAFGLLQPNIIYSWDECQMAERKANEIPRLSQNLLEKAASLGNLFTQASETVEPFY